MRYRSKPTEVDAMQWSDGSNPATDNTAHEVIEWVTANGGEARYEVAGSGVIPRHARIAVRTVNGWACATPGHYVVMGSVEFEAGGRKVFDFYPCDPETFERRWEIAERVGA